jgi:TonB-linked SusC/RagA family outer membrane protein
MKIKYYHFLIYLFIGQIGLAQNIVVKGKVLTGNEPLPGATILVKGTTTGTETDFDGNFSISVPTNTVLVISYLSFITQEVTVTSTSIIVNLKESQNVLDEILVVAQGISKSKRALGYAVTSVSTTETENRPESDLTRTLQGKVSGVQITASNGSSGSVPDIVIRGNLSVTGNNSAMIVVDNVPFAGSLIDLDPNDIKDITFLKGLNAAVLYGSEGRNGVVIVLTKSGNASFGKKSVTASISQTTYSNSVANLPNYQNTYGVGNNLVTDANTVGNFGSNGARFTDVDFVPHPLINDTRFPQFANAQVPFQAARNNVEDFFNTGIGQTTNFNLSARGEKTALNFSVGYTGEEGIIGTNDFKRFNINIGGSAQLTDKLKLTASINYNTTDRTSQSGSTLFENLYIIPRSLDIHNLPFEDPITGANVYYRPSEENPLWIIKNTGRELAAHRFNTILNLDYKISKNHSLKYRGSLQSASSSFMSFRNKGGTGVTSSLGTLDLSNASEFVVDNTLILGSNYKLSDKIGFESQIGANSRFERSEDLDAEYTDQIVYGFFRPNNFRTPGEGDFDNFKENIAGFFGQFDFNYDNYLYLNLSGRYDVSSTLESDNQSLFYPGVSMSFIPTSAFEGLKGSVVNYLKVRAAYAESAGFPGQFRTRNSLASDPREFASPNNGLLVTNSLFSLLANPGLQPELHREFEVGIESKLFNNRVTLDASLFSRISRNQIFNTEIAPSTGFTSTTINAGRVDSEGLEIDLGIALFKGENFNWNMRNAFTSFRSFLIELPGDITRLGDLIEGEQLGLILGEFVVRDAQGNALVDPNSGELLNSDDVGLENQIIGNRTPDWRLTSVQNISYKNFRLSAQFEYTKGGDLFSGVIEDLLERGVTTDTQNREGSFIIPGVLGDVSSGEAILDANGNSISNNIQISGNNATFSNYFNPAENLVFDASVFRIREVSLSYDFNSAALKKLPFSDLTFTLSGRNIFYHAPNLPSGSNLDPESNDFQIPTTRRFALSISAKF